MKTVFQFTFFAMIVFITFGLPFSFFFASALMLEATLIVVGIVVLFFWALFLYFLFEFISEEHDG